MTERTVTVRDGDSLYAIAQRELGDGDKWPSLFALNRREIAAENCKRHIGRRWPNYRDEDWIFPGMELRLPAIPHPRSPAAS